MNDNNVALFRAINADEISVVDSLIAEGSVDVNARIFDDENFVHLASRLGHIEIAERLLDAGVRIDDVDRKDNTACHIAAREGHIDVVKMLVARNANLQLLNAYGGTPISFAIQKKNEPLLMLLIDATLAAGTPLDDNTICDVAAVSTDVIRSLLFKYKINLSTIRGRNSRTPLHQALRLWKSVDLNVLDTLIDVARVDIDARDYNHLTVAHIACALNDADALARFVAAGANLDLADEIGDTPMHGSSDVGTIGGTPIPMHRSSDTATDHCTIVLLAGGANVHARNAFGITPSHRACEAGNTASLAAMMAFGADLDQKNNDGSTPRLILELWLMRWRSATKHLPTTEEVALARQRVLNVRLSFVRKRAFEVCVALQSLDLDALCTCEILLHSCGPVAPFVPFHSWWKIATTIKHGRQQ
jgi:ankyrin repeat protein